MPSSRPNFNFNLQLDNTSSFCTILEDWYCVLLYYLVWLMNYDYDFQLTFIAPLTHSLTGSAKSTLNTHNTFAMLTCLGKVAKPLFFFLRSENSAKQRRQ